MIFVTGANGFVGSVLVNRLIEVGMPVRCVSREKVINRYDKCCEYLQINNLNGESSWGHFLKGCSVVIHLASAVHVMDAKSSKDTHYFHEVNVQGTLNLARQCVDAGIKRFIFVSTIKVLGEDTPTGKSFNETSKYNPKDAYSISKMNAEIALKELSIKTGLEIVIIRPPLVLGENVKGNLASLIKVINAGIPLPFGSLTLNRRSFLAVENLINLIIICITHEKAPGEIFLASDDRDLSTVELLKSLAKKNHKKIILIKFPIKIIVFLLTIFGKSKMAIRLTGNLQVDISHVKKTLEWHPQNFV